MDTKTKIIKNVDQIIWHKLKLIALEEKLSISGVITLLVKMYFKNKK